MPATAKLARDLRRPMCECPDPDVLTEWTGYAGIEHHLCCDTDEAVARDDAGNIINLTAIYGIYDLPDES